MRLCITPHAAKRWNRRVRVSTVREIRRVTYHRLQEQLRLGLESCGPGFYHMQIYPDIRAILTIGKTGEYVAVTYYRKEAGA